MLLSEYIGLKDEFNQMGVFDPTLNQDSHFFINILRLKKTIVPEFRDSYNHFNDFFRKIIMLLDQAQRKDETDTFYRRALKLFSFSEVNEINLGFSKSTTGSGFGRVTERQVIDTAFDIVKAGTKDPEFFQLIPLFQDNVGPDRLSDMIATLIKEDIEHYTLRINRQLNINQETYPEVKFQDGFLIHPIKKTKIYLVPEEILHKLPVADAWEDVSCVASENETIRSEINVEVANEWVKYSSAMKKEYLRESVFKKKESCERVLVKYREENLDLLNVREDADYLLALIEKDIKEFLIKDHPQISQTEDDVTSFSVTKKIILRFKRWIEYNKGWEVVRSFESRKREKHIQRVIHLLAKDYADYFNYDVSCEVDNGRGPLDFKISRGKDKTVLEIKLSSNSKYLHGFKTQIQEYAKAEETSNMIYVLIDMGNPKRVEKVRTEHDKKKTEGELVPELIVVDANEKESASIA